MDAIVGALKSKTIWMAVVALLLSNLVDPVQLWIAAHPGLAGTIVAAVFAALRGVTASSLSDKA